MRIRQVKPEFWSDSKIAELTDSERLFYIGLWMQADDAGWLRWDVEQVAKDLYGFEPRARREKRTAAMKERLVERGRVAEHGCDHLSIPTFRAHQRFGGQVKQTFTVHAEHEKVCVPREPAGPRGDPPGKVSRGKERIGSVRRVSLERASANEEPTEFGMLVGPVPGIGR